jgi:NADH-quinone oxidoreductase subunit D
VDIIETEPALKARTKSVAPISADQIRSFGVVGPVARASGVDLDFRRDQPFPPYDSMDIPVVTHQDGDAWARTFIRAEETRVSLDLCDLILREMPEGEISVRVPRKIPEGEVVFRSEAPRGELFYYLRSDGSDKPARLKIRTPTLPVLSLLPLQLSEINVADIPVVLAGVDLCIACADR